MFGSASGAGNEVNSRIERGNPRNAPAEESWHPLCFSRADGRAEPRRARTRSADIEVTTKSIALRRPILPPIAALIIVLAGQQNGSPAVTAEVPRFVTLARLHSDASSTTAPPGAPVRLLGRLSREEDGLPTALGSAPWWSCWACGAWMLPPAKARVSTTMALAPFWASSIPNLSTPWPGSSSSSSSREKLPVRDARVEIPCNAEPSTRKSSGRACERQFGRSSKRVGTLRKGEAAPEGARTRRRALTSRGYTE